ncbi:uncharacterized protein [Drosophila takahashii]|uniref:uncharacterized protein n=1 Tax=Drosophila takahashii TaxID=29030 RepID=UPI001CF80EA3|nr:uncharacterized protein LOC108063197 [Drosophila takahashii]
MKYFVICALAAFVLLQAASGFKRVVYVVPASTTNTTEPATSTNSTASASTNSTASANTTTVVVHKIVYCSWKNNWCRPTSNTVKICKWGACQLYG